MMKISLDWKNALAPLHIAIAASVFVVDQATKVWIIKNIPEHTSQALIPLLNVVHVKNKGAAFGMFAESSPIFRFVFFGAVSALCLYLLGNWLGSTPKSEKWQRVSLSLILGGALGNLLDRALFGEVTDFIDAYWDTYHWPAFNVADMAISTGVGVLAFLFLLPMFQKKSKRGSSKRVK